MQTPEMSFRIELFGGLIEELNMWHASCEDHEDDDFEYCEVKFIETLKAVRDTREMLLEDLEKYLEDCKRTDIPIDLSYYRILRQLKESTFDLVRS